MVKRNAVRIAETPAHIIRLHAAECDGSMFGCTPCSCKRRIRSKSTVVSRIPARTKRARAVFVPGGTVCCLTSAWHTPVLFHCAQPCSSLRRTKKVNEGYIMGTMRTGGKRMLMRNFLKHESRWEFSQKVGSTAVQGINALTTACATKRRLRRKFTL